MKKLIALTLAAGLLMGGALAQPIDPAQAEPAQVAQAEPAQVAQADPAPVAPSASAQDALAAALRAEAAACENAWEKYLLTQPIERFFLANGTATFALPAWNPDLESLSGDVSSWLDPIWANVTGQWVEGTASIQADASGAPVVRDMDDFVRATKRAAQRAQAAFDQPQMRRALTARLLPAQLFTDANTPTDAFGNLCRAYQGILSPAQLQVALSIQKNASMAVSKGPTALRIVFYHADSASIAQAAYEDACAKIAQLDMVNQYTREQMAQLYANCVSAHGAAFEKSGATGAKAILTIDLPSLMRDGLRTKDFEDYAASVLIPFDQHVDQLMATAQTLPDFPLRDQPETGVITGGATGTKLIFKAPDDGFGRYVMVKDAKTGAIPVTLFVRAGETCTAYAPEGAYEILIGTGSGWYGPVRQFEDAGQYTKTISPVEVLDIEHYHTITLGQSSAPQTATTSATLDDFVVGP
ncbi:MAG: hypothetical protein RSJ41_04140 [Clostridia bacterium]